MAVVRWSCPLARTRARPKLSYRDFPPHIRERQSCIPLRSPVTTGDSPEMTVRLGQYWSELRKLTRCAPPMRWSYVSRYCGAVTSLHSVLSWSLLSGVKCLTHDMRP